MKTDDLVSLLATSSEPVKPHAVERRFAIALGLGMLATGLILASTLGVRPDLRETMLLPMFWIKLLFSLCVALAALSASTRLARPGMRLGRILLALAAMLAVMWAFGFASLLDASPLERRSLILGDGWTFCVTSIALLSIPVFVAGMWAMKGLAPTRLSAAGGAAGLLAGAAGATVFALHCPEFDPSYLAIWYVLGMLLPAAAGAIIGPRLLRW